MDRFYFRIEAKHFLDRIYSSTILEKDFFSETTKNFFNNLDSVWFQILWKKVDLQRQKIHVFDFWKTIFKKAN